ncbi:MAG: T9SS C-terminal target domain-containing protein [Cytophagales bacterium]|nr:MAG: T9SS C-terminal target domain-containing protein [Cytophagales bacterium]
MKFLIALFILVIYYNGSFAQHRHCGQVKYQQLLEKKHKGYKDAIHHLEDKISSHTNNRLRLARNATNTYQIPVVFHIIYNNEDQNISETQIKEQLRVINEDFNKLNKDTANIPEIFKNLSASIEIEFCLANQDPNGKFTNGINRVFTAIKEFDIYFADTILKSLSYWPSDKYLNVWVANLTNDILGYAQFPSQSGLVDLSSDQGLAESDGVVVYYKAFGYNQNSSKYNLGKTLTHEIGHWLGLIHTWGDSFCGNDYVDDTPRQQESGEELKRNNCEQFSSCDGTISRDMTNNFMDWSPDACMNMFTFGQKFRMHQVMKNAPRRILLKQSYGCYKPNGQFSLPYSEAFTDGSIKPQDTLGNSKSRLKWELGFSNRNQYYLLAKNDIQYSGDSLTYTFPFIDFSKAVNAFLDIDIASLSNKNGTIDSIVFTYSPNPEREFTLQKITGFEILNNDLISSFPENCWKNYRISLSKLSGQYIAQVKIKFYSKGISNIAIDNIRFFDNLDRHELLLYPNPTEDVLTAQIIQDELSAMQFEIINAIGKTIRVWEVNKTTLKEIIQLSDLSSGLYFLRVNFLETNRRKTYKFVIQ